MAEFQNPALEDMGGEPKTSPTKRFFNWEGKNVSIYQPDQALQMQEALLKQLRMWPAHQSREQSFAHTLCAVIRAVELCPAQQ